MNLQKGDQIKILSNDCGGDFEIGSIGIVRSVKRGCSTHKDTGCVNIEVAGKIDCWCYPCKKEHIVPLNAFFYNTEKEIILSDSLFKKVRL